MAGTTKRTEFSQALKAIAQERGLDADVIMDTIKQAYIAAYKRDAKERGEEVEGFEYDVEMDSVSGEAKIIAWSEEKPEKKKDVTPPGFGRIAAQTAKQVIHQKIREAEKGAIMDEYSERVGSLVSGMILRFDGPVVRIDIGRTEAIMPASERIPSERLNSSQRLTFLLKSIEDTPRGKQVVLSRNDPDFVRKIFAREVPEIASGSVEIKGIARESGVRTKIAVFSGQTGVDPVGSCVGQKGVRVQAVTNELGGERVDIISWTDDDEEFLKATLAPVEVIETSLNKKAKTALIKVPEDQLSLAIGKEGQNVRLASQLTGWKIEVEGEEDEETEEKSEKTKKTKRQVKAKSASKKEAKKAKEKKIKPDKKVKVTTKKETVSGKEKKESSEK